MCELSVHAGMGVSEVFSSVNRVSVKFPRSLHLGMYIHIQSMVSLIDTYRIQMTYPNSVCTATNTRRRVPVPAFTKHEVSQS